MIIIINRVISIVTSSFHLLVTHSNSGSSYTDVQKIIVLHEVIQAAAAAEAAITDSRAHPGRRYLSFFVLFLL